MSVDKQRMEIIFEKLPEELQNRVIAYAESLLREDSRPESKTSDVASFFGTWDSGDPHSADNDRIDSDLADEYANSHDNE